MRRRRSAAAIGLSECVGESRVRGRTGIRRLRRRIDEIERHREIKGTERLRVREAHLLARLETLRCCLNADGPAIDKEEWIGLVVFAEELFHFIEKRWGRLRRAPRGGGRGFKGFRCRCVGTAIDRRRIFQFPPPPTLSLSAVCRISSISTESYRRVNRRIADDSSRPLRARDGFSTDCWRGDQSLGSFCCDFGACFRVSPIRSLDRGERGYTLLRRSQPWAARWWDRRSAQGRAGRARPRTFRE